jgi:hypothetical protein
MLSLPPTLASILLVRQDICAPVILHVEIPCALNPLLGRRAPTSEEGPPRVVRPPGATSSPPKATTSPTFLSTVSALCNDIKRRIEAMQASSPTSQCLTQFRVFSARTPIAYNRSLKGSAPARVEISVEAEDPDGPAAGASPNNLSTCQPFSGDGRRGRMIFIRWRRSA